MSKLLKESSKEKKKTLKPNTVSHNNACWCTDPHGFLEQLPSGGSLYYKGPAFQKIILGFFWVPSHNHPYFEVILYKYFKLRTKLGGKCAILRIA